MRFVISVVALAACVPSALATASAQEIPTRRAGLWEITITHEGRNAAPQTTHQCTDAETDKLMNAFGGALSADMCSKQEVKKSGTTLVINAVCQVGPMKSISQSVVSGDFSSNYTVKVTSKLEGLPPGMPDAGGTTTIQARWVGACKAGQQPGDIVMSNGQTMNIRDLRTKLDGIPKGAPQGTPKSGAPK